MSKIVDDRYLHASTLLNAATQSHPDSNGFPLHAFQTFAASVQHSSLGADPSIAAPTEPAPFGSCSGSLHAI